MNHLHSIKPGSWCGVPGCPCGGKPVVADPVADTARALARKWGEADAEWVAAIQAGRDRKASDARVRREAVADAARACGPQVEAAFRALVTGDATRAPEVGR